MGLEPQKELIQTEPSHLIIPLRKRRRESINGHFFGIALLQERDHAL